ncbi:MAG: transposase IS66 [Osedax symbiont Rs1]|nr:MAG: transposase IS66 [Osedax symbiont Rs1]
MHSLRIPIRPFTIDRKAWPFADTAQGARASACYSLIETAKANNRNPYTYILDVLEHISEANTPEKLDGLPL